MTPGILTLIVFSIFFTLIIIQFRKIISEKFKIIDHPIEKRKVHAKPTPLIGGIVIIINLFLINLYLILSNQISNIDILILIFCTISFFIGFIDDIKKVSSLKKLILIGIAYLFIGFFDKSFFLNIIV